MEEEDKFENLSDYLILTKDGHMERIAIIEESLISLTNIEDVCGYYFEHCNVGLEFEGIRKYLFKMQRLHYEIIKSKNL